MLESLHKSPAARIDQFNFGRDFPCKDVEGDVSVCCYLTSKRNGPRMASGDLNISSCSKKFGWLVSFVVRIKSRNNRTDGLLEMPSACWWQVNLNSRDRCRKGSYQSKKYVVLQPHAYWLLFNCLINLLCERKPGFVGRTVHSSKVLRPSSCSSSNGKDAFVQRAHPPAFC